jgi:2-keto-3-deoxy-L-rhamnonate aldolase RhmA
VQIETPEALEQVDAIAATNGVDSVFLGPGDLSGAMGHVGNPMHAEVVAAMARAVERIHAVGKPVGSVAATPQGVATYRDIGIDYVGCASDLGLMMRQCAAALAAIRSHKSHVNTT